MIVVNNSAQESVLRTEMHFWIIAIIFQAFAEIIGQGKVQAVSDVIAEAYGRNNKAVASALSEAIVQASSINRRALAEATAQAIAVGGGIAQAFADAFAQAISGGRCDQVAEAFAGQIRVIPSRSFVVRSKYIAGFVYWQIAIADTSNQQSRARRTQSCGCHVPIQRQYEDEFYCKTMEFRKIKLQCYIAYRFWSPPSPPSRLWQWPSHWIHFFENSFYFRKKTAWESLHWTGCSPWMVSAMHVSSLSSVLPCWGPSMVPPNLFRIPLLVPLTSALRQILTNAPKTLPLSILSLTHYR